MAGPANLRAPLMPLAGLGIVLVAAIGAVLISHSMAVGDRAINRSIEIRVRLADLGESVASQNAGFRGYILAGREPERMEAIAATRAVARHYNRLRMIVSDPAQRAHLAALGPMLVDRMHMIDRRMQARQSGALPILTDDRRAHQRALINNISRSLNQMSAEEQRLLEKRERAKLNLVRWLSAALAGAVLLVVVVAYLTVRDARQRFFALRNATREARLAAAAAAKEAAAREDAEAQLRQSQKMDSIGQLTGGIAHDFNNMLAVIVGSLDLARRRIDQPDRVARHISDALEGAGRATTLVSRLLAFSRRQPLTPSSININAFLVELVELLKRVLGETITVSSAFNEGVWPIFADAVQLENSLLNLALNARDAMERGGTLTLSTTNRTIAAGVHAELPEGDYLEIAVADTGAGMDAAVLARAFDPFFTTKAVGKGTGLGLSQVFGFVRQSGGIVTIESVVGQGTCIRLLLPRLIEAPALPSAASDAPVSGDSERLTILLAEDDDRVRRYSADALAELGHAVIAAADGPEALRLLDTAPNVTLLLTDVVMPGMSGPELAATVRSLRPGIRILYTTGYARDGDDATATADLDAPILLKPFSIEDLDLKLRGLGSI